MPSLNEAEDIDETLIDRLGFAVFQAEHDSSKLPPTGEEASRFPAPSDEPSDGSAGSGGGCAPGIEAISRLRARYGDAWIDASVAAPTPAASTLAAEASAAAAGRASEPRGESGARSAQLERFAAEPADEAAADPIALTNRAWRSSRRLSIALAVRGSLAGVAVRASVNAIAAKAEGEARRDGRRSSAQLAERCASDAASNRSRRSNSWTTAEPSASAAASLSTPAADGPRSFREKHGWGRPGKLVEMARRMASMHDMEPEGITQLERAQVEQLRAAILKRMGLAAAPPLGEWRSQHFTRARLLCYLRSRNHHVAKAAERATECILYLDTVVELAREFEESSAQNKQICEACTCVHLFGRDRRGASVLYSRLSKNNCPELAKQTSFEYYLAYDWYSTLFFNDTLYAESLAAGISLIGRVVVLDVSGLTIAAIKRMLELGLRQMGGLPQKEHPLPESVLTMLVCNVPWMAAQFWGSSKRFFPARDVARVQLFKAGDPAFMKELLKYVAIEEVPPLFGGRSTEPWDHASAPAGTTAAAPAGGDGRPRKSKAQQLVKQLSRRCSRR
mmetsp:Transcript_44768/g.104573  ORF Transcript_44768/g.104573 Transcript_44768/m.104573 type:complete len:563 (-) Transcript_44768:238-1926(-)